jgi:hypothetical protein
MSNVQCPRVSTGMRILFRQTQGTRQWKQPRSPSSAIIQSPQINNQPRPRRLRKSQKGGQAQQIISVDSSRAPMMPRSATTVPSRRAEQPSLACIFLESRKGRGHNLTSQKGREGVRIITRLAPLVFTKRFGSLGQDSGRSDSLQYLWECELVERVFCATLQSRGNYFWKSFFEFSRFHVELTRSARLADWGFLIG